MNIRGEKGLIKQFDVEYMGVMQDKWVAFNFPYYCITLGILQKLQDFKKL